jgi:hypothetical protein
MPETSARFAGGGVHVPGERPMIVCPLWTRVRGAVVVTAIGAVVAVAAGLPACSNSGPHGVANEPVADTGVPYADGPVADTGVPYADGPVADTGVPYPNGPVADTGVPCVNDSECLAGICLQVVTPSGDSGRVCSGPCAEAAECVPGWDCSNVAGRGTVCTCSPNLEVCDGMDSDCDGTVDNQPAADRACADDSADRTFACVLGVCLCTSLQCDGECVHAMSDPAHCGGCDPCPIGAHAVAACEAGTCTLACDDGYADCDGNAANGCEALLATDAANCGSCGRSCLGDPCTAGLCAVTMLVEDSGISVLAVDDANLYWIAHGEDIMSLPVAGGTWSALVTAQPGTSDLAVDGTSVYWGTIEGECGQVKKVAREGGTPIVLSSGCDTTYHWGWMPTRLAVDATDVYFLRHLRYGAHLLRVPRDGGEAVVLDSGQYLTELGVGPTAWCSLSPTGTSGGALSCGDKIAGGPALTVDGYVMSRFTVAAEVAFLATWPNLVHHIVIVAVPLDGSPAASVGDPTLGSSTNRVLADADAVYWISNAEEPGATRTIWKASLAGGISTPIANCAATPCDFAVDAQHFYWADGGGIRRIAK